FGRAAGPNLLLEWRFASAQQIRDALGSGERESLDPTILPWAVTLSASALCGRFVPLVVAAEIDRRPTLQRKLPHPTRLGAVIAAGRILAPCRLLRVAKQVGTGDVVEVAHLRATETAEIAFGLIGASAVERIRLAVIDPFHFVFAREIVPAARIVSLHK